MGLVEQSSMMCASRVIEPRRLACPAPERESRKSDRLESDVYNRCVEWAHWSRTRGRFGAPGPVGSVMEAFVRVPGRDGGGPNGRLDPELAAFNAAVVEYHSGHLGRRMFEAHFIVDRTRNIRRLTAEAGISRATWYRTVNAFARAVYVRHLALLRVGVSCDYSVR
jgi:hypothetical protein